MSDDIIFEITDDLPEAMGAVLDEEITILSPHLIGKVLTMTQEEQGGKDESGTLCAGEHRQTG